MPRQNKSRRLSVREKSQNKEDVRNWVTQTQPTKEKKEITVKTRPVEDQEDSSISEDESVLVDEPIRLDGGYGWNVVAISFFLHILLDGSTFSFGLIFLSIIQKFEIQRFTAGSISSTFLSLPLLLSPFAQVIGDQVGMRLLLEIGLSIALIGCSVAMLALYLEILSLFFLGFSIIMPLGMALIYNGAIVIINIYFERRLATATSIAVSGTGVGTMLFPMVIRLIHMKFPEDTALIACGWNALLISIGLFIVYMVVKDPEWNSDSVEFKLKVYEKKVKKFNNERERDDEYELEEDVSPRKWFSCPHLDRQDFRGSIIDLGKDSKTLLQTVSLAKGDGGSVVVRSRSVQFTRRPTLPPIPEYSMITSDVLSHLDHLDLHLGHSPANTIHCKISKNRNRMMSKTSMSVDFINEMDDISHTKICFSESEDDDDEEEESESSDSERSTAGHTAASELTDRILTKEKTKDANGVQQTNGNLTIPKIEVGSRQPRASLHNTGVNQQVPSRILVARRDWQATTNTNQLAHQLKGISAPLIAPRKRNWKEKHWTLGSLCTALSSLPRQFPLYWKLFKEDASLRIFLFSVFFLYTVLDVPYAFFYDHAVETLGISEILAPYLTFVTGLASLGATYLIGVLADMEYMQKYLFLFNGFAMVVLSIAIFFTTIANNFVQMMVISGIFGAFIPSNYVLQSVLLFKLYPDTSQFTISYAMTAMITGGASLIGPPVIGLIRDQTGHYGLVFALAGLFLALSGGFSIWAHWIVSKEPSRSPPRSPSKEKSEVPLLEDQV